MDVREKIQEIEENQSMEATFTVANQRSTQTLPTTRKSPQVCGANIVLRQRTLT